MRVKATAAAGTERSAETKAATVMERFLRGRTFTRPRKTAYATTVVTIAMSVMFTPSAVRPAVGEEDALHQQDHGDTEDPGEGPTSIAASAPPSRCPLVPAATGKFSICTAKMKAATRPASGAGLSRRVRGGRPAGSTAMVPAATTPVTAETGAFDESVRHMHTFDDSALLRMLARARLP